MIDIRTITYHVSDKWVAVSSTDVLGKVPWCRSIMYVANVCCMGGRLLNSRRTIVLLRDELKKETLSSNYRVSD